MKKIEVDPALKLADLLPQARAEDVILTLNGHAVALLSDFSDDDLYWYEREKDPAFIASIAEARTQTARGEAVPHEELMREFDDE
jgi:hypothetical protein